LSLFVFAAVLSAAVMHAAWNAVVKVGFDRLSSVLLLSLAQSAIALFLAAVFPLPAPAAWPWLAASAVLHAGYKIFLIRAYEHGDLSQVYPLARGTAPLVVAVVSAAWLGEPTTPTKTLAVVAIGLGVIVMSRKGGAGLASLSPKALAFALGTAAFTASYTLVDGIGARASAAPSGYTMWIFVGDGMGITAFALLVRGRKAFARIGLDWRNGFAAGALSLASYWIAIWAFTVAPIAQVAALRETSVLFAMLIAIVVLKEHVGGWRWVASFLIVLGIVMMRL
jgi:drug/metabolite transporter (DMT)-like permease